MNTPEQQPEPDHETLPPKEVPKPTGRRYESIDALMVGEGIPQEIQNEVHRLREQEQQDEFCDCEDDSDDDEAEYEENYGPFHPHTIRAGGLALVRLALVICGTILALNNHKEEAEACASGFALSFFFGA